MDTSAFIAGLLSPKGASAEILRLTLIGQTQMLASVPSMIEYEAVASRPHHLAAAGLSRSEVGQLLDALAAKIIAVDIRFL